MDGGIDDALALILALRSPEIDLAGITAVSGNVPVEQAATNALRIVELLDREGVWVAKGAHRPLARKPIRAYQFHGRDGLGDSKLPPPRSLLASKNAIGMIRESLDSTRRRGMTIVCTGPLTNLAVLLRDFPDSKRSIGDVVIMGGAFGLTEYGIGNETPVAEFNIYSDPEAAKSAFDAHVRLKTVGLDVTTNPRLEMTREDYARLRRHKNRVAVFAKQILEKNFREHERFTLHDPMAVGVAVRPAFYHFSEYPVSVEVEGEYTVGMTVADRRSWLAWDRLVGSPVLVCDKVNPRFKEMLLDRLTGE